jgi:uncharacterized membrane protein
MARFASRLAERNDLSVPRGTTPRMGARYDADAFGRFSEAIARFLGTGRFLAGQTVFVIGWIALNTVGIVNHWDPYPFILLNLTFSLQAAYAAPLILLAQTREAERDKLRADADAGHREKLAQRALEQERETQAMTERVRALLEANTRLTEEVHRLTREIHSRFNLAPPSQIVTRGPGSRRSLTLR